MNPDEAKRILRKVGYHVMEEKRLGNDTGWQLRLTSPEIVNVFDNGNFNVQGKPPRDVRTLLDEHR